MSEQHEENRGGVTTGQSTHGEEDGQSVDTIVEGTVVSTLAAERHSVDSIVTRRGRLHRVRHRTTGRRDNRPNTGSGTVSRTRTGTGTTGRGNPLRVSCRCQTGPRTAVGCRQTTVDTRPVLTRVQLGETAMGRIAGSNCLLTCLVHDPRVLQGANGERQRDDPPLRTPGQAMVGSVTPRLSVERDT